MRLTRREFNKLLALSLGLGATGLPSLGKAAGAAGGSPVPAVNLDPTLPLHPLLQYGAKVTPDQAVRVIVQAASASVDVAALAKSAGGDVKETFPFINAFVTDLKLSAAATLAKDARVRYITPNAGLRRHAAVDPTLLKTTYEQALGLPQVWNDAANGATGKGVLVAVIDTGVAEAHPALGSNVYGITIENSQWVRRDKHGHGTHVAGIIAGRDPQGRYVGVAPDATVIVCGVSDDKGLTSLQYLLRALQGAYTLRARSGIRVISMSLALAIPEHYATSPLCAAVEQLWFAGIAVVVSAGNRGSDPDAVWYAPGNDPYVITVGALDNNGTTDASDDSLAPFSSRGQTEDGHAKPDIIAPGRRIIAPLAAKDALLAKQYPNRVTDTQYIRLSGTSMAAPIVAGTIALLLQRFPQLTPDQVKWLLTTTARSYPGQADAAGVVNIAAALQRAGKQPGTANQGLKSALSVAPTMSPPGGTTSGPWTQAYWDQAYWDQAYWDQAYWDQAYWDQAYWDDGDTD